MLEILLSNLELKNKKLSFSMNFPSWRVGIIPNTSTNVHFCPNWWWTAHNLQTLAERVEDDAEFQHLAQALELAAKLPRL